MEAMSDWWNDKYRYNVVINTILPHGGIQTGVFKVDSSSRIVNNFLCSSGSTEVITPYDSPRCFVVNGDIQFLFDFLKVLGIEKKYRWRTTIYVKD